MELELQVKLLLVPLKKIHILTLEMKHYQCCINHIRMVNSLHIFSQHTMINRLVFPKPMNSLNHRIKESGTGFTLDTTKQPAKPATLWHLVMEQLLLKSFQAQLIQQLALSRQFSVDQAKFLVYQENSSIFNLSIMMGVTSTLLRMCRLMSKLMLLPRLLVNLSQLAINFWAAQHSQISQSNSINSSSFFAGFLKKIISHFTQHLLGMTICHWMS